MRARWPLTSSLHPNPRSPTYPALSRPVPTPEPDPTPKPPAAFRALCVNVGADYVGGYLSRLDELELVRADARASLVFATESGSESDATRLNREFAWGGNAFARRGGSDAIALTVHFDPNKWDFLSAEQIITVAGTTHRWGSLVLLRQEASDALLMCGLTHTQYLPKGPNTVPKYDREREAQFGALLRALDKAADAAALQYGQPVGRLAGGDLNSTRTAPDDGPGRAMVAHGYVDANPKGTGIIDRFAVKGVTIHEHKILPTRGGTDHKTAAAIHAEVTAS